jgi:hypothetical protein
MQITHEEAHQLIQIKVDRTLSLTNQELLDSHLKGCLECNRYKQEIEAVEDTLQVTMRKHWNAQVHHLDVRAINEKSKPINLISNLFPTRSIMIGMVIVLFVFTSWQLVEWNNKSAMLITNVSPIPTPSLLLTGTNNNFNSCQKLQYEVQPGDTLGSLAHQFSTSQAALIQLNDLQSENVLPGTKLIVPVCGLTPTRTSRTPTLTTTPMLEPITYTPG